MRETFTQRDQLYWSARRREFLKIEFCGIIGAQLKVTSLQQYFLNKHVSVTDCRYVLSDCRSKAMFVHNISKRVPNKSFMNLSGLRSINFITVAGKITTVTVADSYFVTHSRQISLNLPWSPLRLRPPECPYLAWYLNNACWIFKPAWKRRRSGVSGEASYLHKL